MLEIIAGGEQYPLPHVILMIGAAGEGQEELSLEAGEEGMVVIIPLLRGLMNNARYCVKLRALHAGIIVIGDSADHTLHAPYSWWTVVQNY